MHIAYSVGNSKETKEVYLDKTRLTNNTVIDSKPLFAGDKLYWYADGGIIEYSLTDQTSKDILENREQITNDRFIILSDNNDNRTIHFEQCIDGFLGVVSDAGEMQYIINKYDVH